MDARAGIGQRIARLVREWPPLPASPGYSFTRGDWLLAALLGLAAFGVALWCAAGFPDGMFVHGSDIWYDADPPRVLATMTERLSPWHYRASVHPLFSLLNWPPASLLVAAGLSDVAAVSAVVAACGFLSVAATALAARAVGLPRPAVAGLALIMVSSGGYLSFFGFAETYAFAAMTVALMLLVAAAAPAHRWLWWLLGSASALAGTVTNWTVGLIALALAQPLRRAILLGAAGFLLTAVLAVVQRLIFPNASLFMMPSMVLDEATSYSTFGGDAGQSFWSPLSAIWSVWIGSIVANPAEVVAVGDNGLRMLNNQAIALWAGPPARIAAVAAWAVLLALALADGWRDPRRRVVFLTLVGFLACQMVLHLLYGRVTFLYAGDHLPALILLAAFAWFSRLRAVAVAAGALLLLAGAWANVGQLRAAQAAAGELIAAAVAEGGGTDR